MWYYWPIVGKDIYMKFYSDPHDCWTPRQLFIYYACVYVEADTWQGELQIFPNPLTQQENRAFIKIACRHFEFINSSCCGLTAENDQMSPLAWPVGL